MAFKTADGSEIDDVKRRALRVLYEHCEAGGCGSAEIDGPLGARVDVSYGSEAVRSACQWYRVAAAYSEDDELREALCREAYGKIERALRCYL